MVSLEDTNNSALNNVENSEFCSVTNLPAKSIKAIDKTTVHRICSGQVVLTLATAVKELVENSIDAGATSVEIRLIENGSSLIEVSDNGKGVEPCDFEGLTLKHHTSKLQDFGDLIGVQTFGFRGEALSSLCALSNLTVITRHQNQTVGTKLMYNTNGQLLEQVPISRQVGTTVSLENLFYTLPVRHKEFLRNLKKEFNKMVQILYSYCLVTTNVRIVCTNLTGKNKTTVVSTESHSSLKENISSIFGHKQVANLLAIQQKPPNEEILTEYGVRGNDNCEFFHLEGFVSSCDHGKGRSAADRQFYFINNRPCDPAKVNRVVNEVYHHYNKHQFPMIVLNMSMEKEDVDINVTPDKRQIFFNREKLLLATVKATLISLYEDIPSTLSVQKFSVSNFNSPKITSSPNSPSTPNSTKLSALMQRFSRTPSTPTSCSPTLKGIRNNSSYGSIKRALTTDSEFQTHKKQSKLQDFSFNQQMKTLKNADNTSDQFREEITNDLIQPNNELMSVINDSIEESHTSLLNDSIEESHTSLLNDSIEESHTSLLNDSTKESHTTSLINNGTEESHTTSLINNGTEESHTYKRIPCLEEMNGSLLENCEKENRIPKTASNVNLTPTSKEIHCKTETFLNALKCRQNKSILATKLHSAISEEEDILSDEVILVDEMDVSDSSAVEKIGSRYENVCGKIVYDDMDCLRLKKTKTKIKSIPFCLEFLKQRIRNGKKKRNREAEMMFRKFRAQISPLDNKSAEDELKKEITKESFCHMKVIGQFNLGFMITCLHSDLFIIDQHATDEKYNFETLQKTCVMQNQKLIIPQTLELTAANEGILIDNLEIFVKNGFEFSVDETKDVGRRAMLTSMPYSKGWEFNKEDVEEMIFMLSDSPGVMCRPSRINAMFASRACRKSVMIGTHLSGSQMRKLVDHMGEIEQPWNCPHGRPTIRHLINLDVLTKILS